MPANVNTVLTAAHANIEEQGLKGIDKIKTAAEKMRKDGLQKIHINKYLTLYNGNKSGKGRARPRLRISNLPVRIAQPSLSMMDLRSAANGYHNIRMIDGDTLKTMAKNRASQHWSGRLSLRGFGAGGVLAVAPSAILDAMSSIERDVDGDWAFNSRKFALASARSQSGNLAGWATYAVAVAFFGAGAPVIIIAMIGGILVTAAWNTLGGADWAEEKVRRALEK